MELNHLKYFYLVAREKSFTKAAKILRVQQPTVSKMVAGLEEKLGLTLLERHRRGVRLTNSGSEVFKNCENIFGIVDEIASLSEKEQKECHGLLSLGITDSVCNYVLPGIMGEFIKIHPKVRPSIFAGSSNLICNEISEGRVEFGLFYTKPRRDEFQLVDLVNVPFKFIIARDHYRKASVRSAIIISRDVDYPKAKPFPVLEMLLRQHIDVNVAISSNSLEAQKQMVINGMGVALLPGFMLRKELQAGTLLELHPKKKFSYPLRLVTRKHKVLSKNANTFLDVFSRRVHDYVRDGGSF